MLNVNADSEHAEPAIELYEGLYDGKTAVDEINGLNVKKLESKLTTIMGAEGVLEAAKADRERYPPEAYTGEDDAPGYQGY